MQSEIFQILPGSQVDLPAILEIEHACYPQPWSIAQFQQELDNPVAHLELLWCQGRLAGYLCYWLIAGEMQILNVATAPQWQRKGVAARLVDHCLRRCRQQGLERAWLEVRVSNRAAISVYRRQGFVATGVRQNYYRDGEDALLMVLGTPQPN